MYISDTLSRASLSAREDKATIFEIHELTEKFELEDHHFVSDHCLTRINEETSQDTTLLVLIEITKKGWPPDKNDSPLNVREYWPYRDELARENGLGLSRHTPHHTDKTEARDGRQGTQVPLRHPVHPKY